MITFLGGQKTHKSQVLINESNVVKGPVQVLVIFAISSETPRTETN